MGFKSGLKRPGNKNQHKVKYSPETKSTFYAAARKKKRREKLPDSLHDIINDLKKEKKCSEFESLSLPR